MIYVLCMMVICTTVLSFQIEAERAGDPQKDWVQGLLASPPTLVTAGVTFFSIWSLISLTLYHFHLLRIGQTTNENLKNVFKSILNPFDQGFFGNLYNACFSERSDSHLSDQTDVLTDKQYIDELFFSSPAAGA